MRKNADHRADIFALGKMLFELLTGQIPYPHMDFAKLPKKYIYIVQKACDNVPDNRYQSVEEMIEDIGMVTKEEQLLTRPAEELRNLVGAIMADQAFDDKRSVLKIARLLAENTDDYTMLTSMLPKLPEPILRGLLENHPKLFIEILKAYDETLEGSLPFEYCDIVADFYQKLFNWTSYYELKIIILKRLPLLGHAHNRWHVGHTFGEIVGNLSDKSLVLAVRDILKSDKSIAEWCEEYLKPYSLPIEVRQVLKRLTDK